MPHRVSTCASAGPRPGLAEAAQDGPADHVLAGDDRGTAWKPLVVVMKHSSSTAFTEDFLPTKDVTSRDQIVTNLPQSG
jgi:hypothetical protein